MTSTKLSNVAILHYTAAPVVGGVENVILEHTHIFLEAGYPITILAGRGEKEAFPPGTGFVSIPELDSKYPEILKLSDELDEGRVPPNF